MKNKGSIEKIFIAIVISVITSAVMLLEAQWIVWGLSMYHINSGIWPVWLIGLGFEGILCMGVAAGIRAVRDE